MKKLVNGEALFTETTFAGAIVVLSLLWVYWPGLGVAYDFHDSFYAYSYVGDSCSAHPQWGYFFYVGRPIYAFINCFAVANLIDVLQDTITVRWIAFCILAVNALVMFILIRSMAYSLVVAVAIAIGISTLPGMQIFLHLTQASPIFWGIPFVVLAAHVFNRGENHFLSCFSGYENALKSLFLIVVIAALLMICSLIYQQISSLFFLFVCMLCLSPRHRPSLKRMFTLLTVAAIAYGLHGLMYLILHKQVVLPHSLVLMNTTLEAIQGQTFDVVVSFDVLGKLGFLSTDLWDRGLRLWSVGYAHPMTGILPWLLPLGILSWCVNTGKQAIPTMPTDSDGLPKQFLHAGFAALVVIFISFMLVNAPNLIAQTSSVAGRHVIAFQGLIITIVCIGFTYIPTNALDDKSNHKLSVYLVLVFISVGCMQARQNFDFNMAGLAQKEITYIRNALAPRMSNLPERIIVIQPHVKSLAQVEGLLDVNDENGKLTTSYPQDVPWIVIATFMDLNGERSELPKIEVVGCCGTIPDFKTEDLVIDMRVFVRNILHERVGFLPPSNS